ncbi:hypothetical protein Plhal703r1_c15g0072431 [Plasmopara halstedii]
MRMSGPRGMISVLCSPTASWNEVRQISEAFMQITPVRISFMTTVNFTTFKEDLLPSRRRIFIGRRPLNPAIFDR